MIGAVMQIGQGIAGVASFYRGRSAREQETSEAQMQYDLRRSQYEAMDTSNPYANMQNTMADLTINQQQAQFAAQQQQQALANTMSGMQMAAGGSGIAALAQSMANQQSMNLQQASADIGAQESRNQMNAAQQAASIQQMERQGDVWSRNLQREKTETLLGMEQQRLGAAKEAEDQAQMAKAQGWANVVGGVGMAANELGATYAQMYGFGG